MQLSGILLNKNHDLEQQIFVLERKNDELMGLTGGPGAGCCTDGNTNGP